MSEQDEQWFDALAGHRAPATAADARLHQALRQAAAHEAQPQRDELAEQRLLRRLQAEGLLPIETKPTSVRLIWPRLAQVAVIVLCVGVVLQLVRPPVPQFSEKAATKQDAAPQSKSGAPDAAGTSRVAPAEQSFSAPARVREYQAAPAPSALEQAPPATERVATPAFTLHVLDVNQALARLQQQLDDESALEQLPAVDGAKDNHSLRLRCQSDAACTNLIRLLRQLDAKQDIPELVPGPVVTLHFEQRP